MTRNGIPVGELRPARRRFVSRDLLLEMFASAPRIDAERFRGDLVSAATRAQEREPRGARAVDLLIAATALANDLALFTRNPDDFDHLEAVGLELHTV